MARQADITLRADIKDLTAELRKGNKLTEAEVKRMVKGVTTNLRKAEQASTKLWNKARKKGPQKYTQAISGMKGIFTAIIGGVAVQQVGKLVSSFATLNDQIQDMRDQAMEVGESVEEFQKVQGAIGLVTRDTTAAADTINRFRRQLADARDGTREAVDALNKLGIQADTIADLPLGEQVEFIAAGIATLGSQADQTQVAMDLFGRSGAKLIPLLSGGAQAVRSTFEEVEAAGLISSEAAEQADNLDDQMFLLGRTWMAFKSDLLTEVSPALQQTTVNLREMLAEARETGQLEETAEALSRLAEGDVLSAIEDLADLTLFLSSSTGKLIDAYTILTATIKLPRAAIADLIWEGDKLGTAWENLGDAARPLLFWMSDGSEYLTPVRVSMEDFAAATDMASGEVSDLVSELTALGSAAVAHVPDRPKKGGGKSDEQRARERQQEEAKRAHERALSEMSAALRAYGSDAQDVWFSVIESQLTAEEQIRLSAFRQAETVRSSLEELLAAHEYTLEQRNRLQAAADEVLIAIKEQTQGQLRQLADQKAKEDRERNESAERERLERLAREAQAEANARNEMRGYVETYVSASMSLQDTLTAAIISNTKEGTEERRRAEAKAFVAHKIAALAAITVSTAQSLMASAEVGFPAAIPGVLAAAAAGTAATAMAAAEQPTFHTGGEVVANLETGEHVSSRQAVRNAGGHEVFDQLERGGGPLAGGRITVIQQVNNRTTFAAEYEAIRTGESPYSAEIAAMQPERRGLRNPYAEV